MHRGRSTLWASTRLPADTIEGLGELLSSYGVEPLCWYGVRLFTDGWSPTRPPTDDEDGVLAVELEEGRPA